MTLKNSTSMKTILAGVSVATSAALVTAHLGAQQEAAETAGDTALDGCIVVTAAGSTVLPFVSSISRRRSSRKSVRSTNRIARRDVASAKS